jgi:predicted ArsR family transcriptional regulator
MNQSTTDSRILLALILAPMTAAELSACIGVSRNTVYGHIRKLAAGGRIRAAETVQGKRGAPRTRWSARRCRVKSA